jgi:hypothetical protein
VARGGTTQLLFCDETTIKRHGGAAFFLYCGLVLAPPQFGLVCDLLARVRQRIGLLASEPLKFTTRQAPKRLDHQTWTSAKSEVLAGLGTMGLPLIGVYVHEAIANSQSKTHWALDALCVEFNKRLVATGDRGLVVVDHTRELDRSDAAEIASGTTAVSIFTNKLSAVGGVASGHVEAMLPLQAVDILVGSLRYCLENPTHDVSAEIASALVGLDIKLERRPWNVKVPEYLQDYLRLSSDWRDLRLTASVLVGDS